MDIFELHLDNPIMVHNLIVFGIMMSFFLVPLFIMIVFFEKWRREEEEILSNSNT